MPLTLQWWTDIKSRNEDNNGQKAPETEFEKKLKIYDNERKTLDSVPAVERATKAMGDVENARRTSMDALQKSGFPKLANYVSPNSRLLNTLIQQEKTMLAEKDKEQRAKRALGSPKIGLGPGDTIRKKTFEALQNDIKKLNEELKRPRQLTKDILSNWSKFLEALKKEVELYCKDRAGAKQFHDDYMNTVEGFKKVKDKWGDQKKVTEEMLKIGNQVKRMVDHHYVA